MCIRTFFLRLAFVIVFAAYGCHRKPPSEARSQTDTRGPATLTFLGVAGWKFEANGHVLLFDPYFTRVDPDALPKDAPIEPDRAAVERWAPKKADVILVS